MWRSVENIFWLGTKELRSVFSDLFLIAIIAWAFSFSIYQQAVSMGETVNNASVAVVDEDRSILSGRLALALYPPFFKQPELIDALDIDDAMNKSRYMFVIVIPPDFEADVRKGRQPTLQVNIDATAVMQASLGMGYIQNILLKEINRFVKRSDEATALPVDLVVRRAFNPNGTQSWFRALAGLLDMLTVLTIVLTGAALIREREHGTIEHLLVMPLTAFQIVVAKVWANGVVILAAFTLSLIFMVEGLLDVPVAGSKGLLLAGTSIYLFAAAAIGIFLGTIARTMAQFSLLIMMTILPMMLLSGGLTPIESQPELIQPVTWLFPSRHYIAFAQAIVFRGAGLEIIWPDFLRMGGLGLLFFAASLTLFRRSINTAK